MAALQWLNEQLGTWLGEKGVGDTLMKSVSGNVTSEMGRALLDVADTIRGHPEVVAFLEDAGDDGFLDELTRVPGGPEAREAIHAFLETYGMRYVGEIDITRPRWSEHPIALVPLILGNVRNFGPGAAQRQFEQGLREAGKQERDLLRRLRAQPGGAGKAAETKQMIDRLRTFIGYREYPKYAIVSRHFVYKQALLEEADRLVRRGVLRDREDIFFLSLDELDDIVRTGRLDEKLVALRREEFVSQHTLRPPRVLTSEGEALQGAYRRADVPAGVLAGVAVSAGVAEGRARVVHDIAQADLVPGDILVAVSTDPSWSPAFVAISGIVTEVGGLMTHGAVIAPEYGLPAVVGVAQATRLIRNGQGIRVHGTEGYVELHELAADSGLTVLRLLCDRRDELSAARAQALNRMHRLFAELIPGGAPVKKTTAQYQVLLATVRPRDLAGKTRRRMAAEELADIGRLDAKLKAMKAELTAAVLASGSHLMDIHGIGPAGAARILADVGDVARFPNRAHFASWTGTAPIDASSGQHTHHRLSRAGNRRINHVPCMAGIVQLRNDTPGRGYYRRRVAAGKTSMEAMRCLRRRLSDVAYRQLAADGQARVTGQRARGDSVIQRGRPSPGHRHFGPATSRTRTHDATPATGEEDTSGGPGRRHTTPARRRCQRGAPRPDERR